jgi:hypothetical protein
MFKKAQFSPSAKRIATTLLRARWFVTFISDWFPRQSTMYLVIPEPICTLWGGQEVSVLSSKNQSAGKKKRLLELLNQSQYYNTKIGAKTGRNSSWLFDKKLGLSDLVLLMLHQIRI